MHLMSFTMATVYAPLILIALLYLLTIIYTIVLGIQFHGWKNWISQTLNDPVYFIFPILTSISFYGKQNNDIEEENSESSEEKDNIKMHFSIKQSNILYMLFLLGSVLGLFSDVYIQTLRGIYFQDFWKQDEVSLLGTAYSISSLSPYSVSLLVILPINILLWIDFILVARSSGDTQGTK